MTKKKLTLLAEHKKLLKYSTWVLKQGHKSKLAWATQWHEGQPRLGKEITPSQNEVKWIGLFLIFKRTKWECSNKICCLIFLYKKFFKKQEKRLYMEVVAEIYPHNRGCEQGCICN